MLWFRVIFLLSVMMATSGYIFRCTWMCTDQTAIQEDYVEQRDHCRELAQLEVNTSSAQLSDTERKAQLVSDFSECMGQHGWTVPEGGKEKPAAAPAAAAAAGAAASAPPTTPNPAEERASLTRASECAFARQAADVSTISAARAKACDLECEQALQASPEAPRPAACPADFKESLSKGTEKY